MTQWSLLEILCAGGTATLLLAYTVLASETKSQQDLTYGNITYSAVVAIWDTVGNMVVLCTEKKKSFLPGE